MIFLKQSLKAYISNNANHQSSNAIEKKNASNNTFTSYTETRVLQLHKNIKLDNELSQYIDQQIKDLRSEMEAFMEILENKLESKLMNKFKSI